MADAREKAQRKNNNERLPKAPKKKERGRREHPGHLTPLGPVSQRAFEAMPRARRALLERRDRPKSF